MPVTREVFADLDTPLDHIKLANTRYGYLRSPPPRAGRSGGGFRWSGCHRRRSFAWPKATSRSSATARSKTTVATASHWHSWRVARAIPLPADGPADLPGGLVEYFGYDTVRYVEDKVRATSPEDTLSTPDILLMVSNDVIVFDSVKSWHG